MQNKTFIYRGKEYEWLEDFSVKVLSGFPNGVRMTSTAPPGDAILNSPGQRILHTPNKERDDPPAPRLTILVFIERVCAPKITGGGRRGDLVPVSRSP